MRYAILKQKMVPELEARQTQIQRIVQSKAFRTSAVHRNLLTYLAEKSLSGTADGLKEYTVGLDVFSKPSSYDPRQESVVRMHMARLRQKLTEYYRTEGIEDPIARIARAERATGLAVASYRGCAVGSDFGIYAVDAD